MDGKVLKIMRALPAVLAGVALMLSGVTAYAETKDNACVTCHGSSTKSIVGQWRESQHAKHGINCVDCHVAKKGAPGAREHMGQGYVSPIVSPNVCGKCHPNEQKEFTASHHSKAAKFIGSLDNVLGEIIEGSPAANSGCKQCHGSTVIIDKDGKLDPTTWPNSGIGRVNPDGSEGACSACHMRHTFSIAQVREPDICGKCHMGPDHPQIEIYNESKHGIAFKAYRNKMNMDKHKWVVGEDYTAAPVCATCHMSATSKQPVTHDIGARISWTLRPAVSFKLENWEAKRDNMKEVCSNCHSGSYVNNFYSQFDGAVNLYNEKFGKPAKSIMDKLYAEKLLTDTPFDEKIEWTYYLMWHHEGRRARHGASMMGPDYTQWHGFFEVANRFYNELLPEAEELKKGVTEEVLRAEYHKWKSGMSKEDREKILEFYKSRYGQ
ncbi:MAG: multiheme c-type cytochrome [Armatimonadota bacterium]|nr:multiheme c-type cytochrome [Armatimonadota bacterium]